METETQARMLSLAIKFNVTVHRTAANDIGITKPRGPRPRVQWIVRQSSCGDKTFSKSSIFLAISICLSLNAIAISNLVAPE